MVRASSLELGCRDLDSHLGLRIFSVLSGDQIEKMVDNFLGSVTILPSSHNNGWRPMMMTTAVKRLNRYFCLLLLGFHLPVREKWAKMYKSVSQHNYLSIFLKILSFFR